MVRLTDRSDMTLDVTVEVKRQYNNNKFKPSVYFICARLGVRVG